MNVTEGYDFFAYESIKVGNEEAGTSDLNQLYDTLKANKDKDQTSNILDMLRWKVHG